MIAGIIGYAQRTSDPHNIFCIFGNREAGEKARISLLNEVYGKSTIAATMAKYAPKSEGNDNEQCRIQVEGKGIHRGVGSAGYHRESQRGVRAGRAVVPDVQRIQIARGMDATKAKTWPVVPIDWAHRSADGTPDPVTAKRAAEAMCAGYCIHPHSAQQKVGKPAFSNHNKRAAIDMNVSGYVAKTVKNKAGDDIKLTTFTHLVSVDLTYGVIYYNQEKMHWSTDGH